MAMHNFVSFFSKDKTFKQKKKFILEGTMRYDLHKRANASLNTAIDLKAEVKLPSDEDLKDWLAVHAIDLKFIVKLPPDEDLNDWLAVHVVDFFNRINVIYGVVTEFCVEQTCPTMSGGPKYEYHWCDHVKYKKPTKLPAPQYIALLMDWVEDQVNNEDIFPSTTGTPFPKNYMSTVKKILTRLFRVFVHVYIHHFDKLVAMGAEPHVNTCYKHFYYFVSEFNLVQQKELEPLKSNLCYFVYLQKQLTERLCH